MRMPPGELKPIAVPGKAPVSGNMGAAANPTLCSPWQAKLFVTPQVQACFKHHHHSPLLIRQGASPSRTPDRSPRRRISATGMLRRVSNAATGGLHSRQSSVASVTGADVALLQRKILNLQIC